MVVVPFLACWACNPRVIGSILRPPVFRIHTGSIYIYTYIHITISKTKDEIAERMENKYLLVTNYSQNFRKC